MEAPPETLYATECYCRSMAPRTYCLPRSAPYTCRMWLVPIPDGAPPFDAEPSDGGAGCRLPPVLACLTQSDLEQVVSKQLYDTVGGYSHLSAGWGLRGLE